MVAVRRATYGRVFYAHSDIWRFRGIERLSDYLKIKGRDRKPGAGAKANSPQDRRRFWRFLSSDKALTIILVLIGVASLIVMLL
jgi:hypothetical protein